MPQTKPFTSLSFCSWVLPPLQRCRETWVKVHLLLKSLNICLHESIVFWWRGVQLSQASCFLPIVQDLPNLHLWVQASHMMFFNYGKPDAVVGVIIGVNHPSAWWSSTKKTQCCHGWVPSVWTILSEWVTLFQMCYCCYQGNWGRDSSSTVADRIWNKMPFHQITTRYMTRFWDILQCILQLAPLQIYVARTTKLMLHARRSHANVSFPLPKLQLALCVAEEAQTCTSCHPLAECQVCMQGGQFQYLMVATPPGVWKRSQPLFLSQGQSLEVLPTKCCRDPASQKESKLPLVLWDCQWTSWGVHHLQTGLSLHEEIFLWWLPREMQLLVAVTCAELASSLLQLASFVSHVVLPGRVPCPSD